MTTADLQASSLDRPRSSKQVVSIQYLRAVAALIVVASHTHPIVSFGQCGVDIFFVISGYIMWMIARASPSADSFVTARLTRIVPLYWIATIIMGLHQHAAWPAIVKSMFFIPFIGEQNQIWPVLVQGWTLNYEMYFYLIVAGSLFIPIRWRLWTVLLVLAGLSLVGALVRFSDPLLKTYTNPLLLEFCFGILLFEYRERLWSQRLVAPALVIVGVALDVLLPEPALLGLSRVLTWGIPGALIVAGALGCERAWTVKRVPVLLLLGEASYAVYLFHPFILKTVLAAVSDQPPLVGTLTVVIVSTVVGVVVTLAFERPVLAIMRRWMSGSGPVRVT